jgi:hypothetical protein
LVLGCGFLRDAMDCEERVRRLRFLRNGVVRDAVAAPDKEVVENRK